MVARADRDREEEADHRERASGQQPLQLLAQVTPRAAVEDDLADDPRERDRDEEEHDDGEAGVVAAAAELLELAGGVDPDRVLGEGAEVRDHEVADQDGHERDVHPERPTPPPRDLAVGEEEDRQRQEHEHRRPPLGQEDGEPRERKAVVVDVVGTDGVEAGVGAVGRSDGDREEEPADRVPRLPARDERADGRERDHQQQLPDPAEGELVRERRQRETRHDQQCGGSAEPECEVRVRTCLRGHRLIQTLTWVGSSEAPAAAASSSRTVSTSTAFRRRVANAATVVSAS